MSMNILNDISDVYVQEVLKPKLGVEKPKAKEESGAKEGPKDPKEASAKKIRQAVYDIRYRARREEVPLPQAYNQYMSHTTMSGPEKAAVKAKLGEEFVTEAEDKKFKVRVTDKNSGKSYVRYATREKINALRSNPNISSVEMTQYGSPYEGEKKKGEQTAKTKSGKGLDPVGSEDKDIDNDGDHDKTDKYLLNRRKVRGAAIAKKSVKEGYSNWREDLREIADEVEGKKKESTIKEKKIKNKVVINPKLGEAVEAMGGQLIEMVELEEGMTMKDFKKQRSRQKQKEKRAADKIAPNRRKDIHTDRLSPERAARHRANVDPDFEGNDERNYPGGKLKNPKKVRKAKALGELGEAVLDEKTLTSAETKKKEEIVKSMKKSAGDFEKRYPGRGKEVMYATATKMAKKVAEQAAPQQQQKQADNKTADVQADAQKKQQLQQLRTMMMKKRQIQNQELALQKQGKLPVDTHATEEFVPEAKAIGSTRSTDVNPKGAAVRASSGRGMTMTPAKGLGASKPAGDDKARAAKQKAQAKADRIAAARDRAASGEDRLGRLIRSVQKDNYQPEGDLVDEARASEKRGMGSPEKSLSYPGRKVQKQRGEMGGRHWQSGGQGGSKTERGRKKSDPNSQAQRLRKLSTYPEQPGKYAKMQRKKTDLGSRFD